MGCGCNSNTNSGQSLSQMDDARAQWENEVDYNFMLRVQAEVTQSCALPFALPIDRLPAYILQAAQYFWEECDFAAEERMYFIHNRDICKPNNEGKMNKIVQLPPQIIGVHGVFKTKSAMRYGTMGDFSLERMMMSTYSAFGGMGTVANGFQGTNGYTGFSLTDIVVGLYEVDTFQQNLNPTLTYNFNRNTHKLVILGDLGYSDVLINCMKRVPIQALYENYYFFRMVVALAKRALNTIYGTYEFKLPGGVTINYSMFNDQADADIEEIKEWIERNRTADYFFNPNVL